MRPLQVPPEVLRWAQAANRSPEVRFGWLLKFGLPGRLRRGQDCHFPVRLKRTGGLGLAGCGAGRAGRLQVPLAVRRQFRWLSGLSGIMSRGGERPRA